MHLSPPPLWFYFSSPTLPPLLLFFLLFTAFFPVHCIAAAFRLLTPLLYYFYFLKSVTPLYLPSLLPTVLSPHHALLSLPLSSIGTLLFLLFLTSHSHITPLCRLSSLFLLPICCSWSLTLPPIPSLSNFFFYCAIPPLLPPPSLSPTSLYVVIYLHHSSCRPSFLSLSPPLPISCPSLSLFPLSLLIVSGHVYSDNMPGMSSWCCLPSTSP